MTASSHLLSKTTDMFRLAARNFTARNVNVAARLAVAPRLALAARAQYVPRAQFSAAAGLSKEDITTRVLDVLKSFEKVDGSKVSSLRSFFSLYARRPNCEVFSFPLPRRLRRTSGWTVWTRSRS